MAKRGKYADVIDTLPRQFGTEPAYQERVEMTKNFLMKDKEFQLQGSYLAKQYTELRQIKDQIEDELSGVNLRLEAISQLMVDQFENEGISSMRTADGKSVSTSVEPYSQVVDKDAFRQWCVEQGLERQMALPWQTTNMLVKARLLEGEPEPPGVSVFAKPKVKLLGS